MMSAMRKGWTETTLGEVAEWYSGGTPRAGKAEFYEDGTIPWVVIADMMKTEIFDTASKITAAGLTEIGGKLAPQGSVLISMYATVGRPGYAHLPVATNQAIAWSVPDAEVISSRFLLLAAQYLEPTISSMARGATQRNINRAMLREFSFNLPPLPEQKRIVDIVSSVDAYIDALQKQADTLRTARNAVLNELLSAGGNDWTKTTLGDVLAIQSGFAFSTNDWAVEGYPVIKINNVRDGKVSTESCSFIADPIPQGAEKFLLKTGDLLITLTGEIGATGTVGQTFPMYLNQRVGRVSIHKESKDLLQYLAVLFNYPPVRAEMRSLGKGNAQLNISPKSIHEIEVNLPPLPEQRRIVEIVSSMDEVIQSTEQAVIDAKNLRSGLLSDLLSGEHEIPESYDRLLGAA